jgi:adenylate cyclase
MAKGTVWKAFGLALLCYALLWLAARYQPQWMHALDYTARDFYYQVRGEQPLSPRIKIVGYTENTLSAFADQKIYFPLPRGWHGLALKRLADAGAKVVVFDILFSEEGSWDPEEDQQLADAVKYAQGKGCTVVLASAIDTVDQGQVNIKSLVGPSDAIMQAQPRLGLSNALQKLSYKLYENVGSTLPLGADGADVMYYSQAVAAFQAVCAQDGRDFAAEMRRADPSHSGSFMINYCCTSKVHPESYVFYETLFPEIQDGESQPRALTPAEQASLHSLFDNSVAFVGSRASADNDYFLTPYGQMFGVETNAQAFDTLLRNRFIRVASPAAIMLAALGLVLAAWGLSLLRPILRGAASEVLMVVLLMSALAGAFIYLRLDTNFTTLSLALLFPFVVCTTYGGILEELGRRQLRGTFSRYLSDEMVQQVLAHPELANIGGGVERKAVVLFSDIRSYSTISEHMPPDQVVDMLNRYFGKVAESILNRGGSIDKYLGDGLMGSFGGMIPLDHPADDALDAALDMIRVLYDKVHPELKEQGITPFKIGVGLHYGDVIVGTMGHARRSDLTMIGDAVNLASRVEGMTKEYGWAVVITRDVVDALGDKAAQYDIQLVGETTVKGREQPVEMFRVVDPARAEIYRL